MQESTSMLGSRNQWLYHGTNKNDIAQRMRLDNNRNRSGTRLPDVLVTMEPVTEPRRTNDQLPSESPETRISRSDSNDSLSSMSFHSDCSSSQGFIDELDSSIESLEREAGRSTSFFNGKTESQLEIFLDNSLYDDKSNSSDMSDGYSCSSGNDEAIGWLSTETADMLRKIIEDPEISKYNSKIDEHIRAVFGAPHTESHADLFLEPIVPVPTPFAASDDAFSQCDNEQAIFPQEPFRGATFFGIVENQKEANYTTSFETEWSSGRSQTPNPWKFESIEDSLPPIAKNDFTWNLGLIGAQYACNTTAPYDPLNPNSPWKEKTSPYSWCSVNNPLRTQSLKTNPITIDDRATARAPMAEIGNREHLPNIDLLNPSNKTSLKSHHPRRSAKLGASQHPGFVPRNNGEADIQEQIQMVKKLYNDGYGIVPIMNLFTKPERFSDNEKSSESYAGTYYTPDENEPVVLVLVEFDNERVGLFQCNISCIHKPVVSIYEMIDKKVIMCMDEGYDIAILRWIKPLTLTGGFPEAAFMPILRPALPIDISLSQQRHEQAQTMQTFCHSLMEKPFFKKLKIQFKFLITHVEIQLDGTRVLLFAELYEKFNWATFVSKVHTKAKQILGRRDIRVFIQRKFINRPE